MKITTMCNWKFNKWWKLKEQEKKKYYLTTRLKKNLIWKDQKIWLVNLWNTNLQGMFLEPRKIQSRLEMKIKDWCFNKITSKMNKIHIHSKFCKRNNLLLQNLILPQLKRLQLINNNLRLIKISKQLIIMSSKKCIISMS